jgi:hypothetical protein
VLLWEATEAFGRNAAEIYIHRDGIFNRFPLSGVRAEMIGPDIKREDKTMLKSRSRIVAMALMVMTLTIGTVELGYAGAVSRPKIGNYLIERRSTDTFEIMFYGNVGTAR